MKKKKKNKNNLVEEEEDSNKILNVPKTKKKAEKTARGNMGGYCIMVYLETIYLIIQVQQDLGASFDAELFHFVTADATGT